MGVERVAERAVQHQQLPQAVGLGEIDDRPEPDGVAEPVLPHELHHARVVLGCRGMEAVRPVGLVRMAMISARDDGDALVGAGRRDGSPGSHVRFERELPGRADDDDRRLPVGAAADEPQRDQRSPVHWHLGERRIVAAEAHAGRRAYCAEGSDDRMREHTLDGAREPGVGAAEIACDGAGSDDRKGVFEVDPVRREHDRRVRRGRFVPPTELLHCRTRRRVTVEDDPAVRSYGAEDDHAAPNPRSAGQLSFACATSASRARR